MRKPDDDLKIDIADIFGGDVSGPSETVEDAAPSAAPAAAATPSPAAPAAEAPAAATAEAESRFRDWMENQNAELERKTRELEQRLQDLQTQLAAGSTPPSPPPPVAESSPAPVEMPAATAPPSAPPTAGSPIDFNAPIAPPFMGGVNPAPNPAAPSASPTGETMSAEQMAQLKRTQADQEFLLLYDEFRNIIAHELKDLVGYKKTYTMLERTVELARTKYPEIFRNANWDSAGNLLEDGSMDSQRVIENKNALDPSKAEVVLDTALGALLNLRLQAVEKGLGTGLKNKVRAHLFQWISEKTQKAGREGKDTANMKRLSGYVAQIS